MLRKTNLSESEAECGVLAHLAAQVCAACAGTLAVRDVFCADGEKLRALCAHGALWPLSIRASALREAVRGEPEPPRGPPREAGADFTFDAKLLFSAESDCPAGHFVLTLALPPLLGLLASYQEWFRDVQPWVDFQFAQMPLFNGALSTEQWQQLGVAGTIWLVVPLLVGLVLVRRAEVK